MATIIYTDGSEKQVEPANGKDFSLEELHAIVGGWVERVRLANGKFMWLHEEGKLEGLPVNKRATLMARGGGIAHDDFIVGNVLIAKDEEVL